MIATRLLAAGSLRFYYLKLDGAVVADLQLGRERPDAQPPPGAAAQRQQGLVLAGRQPRAQGGLLAEAQEPSQPLPHSAYRDP